MNTFWQFSFGNLITIVGLLLSFWLAHRANIQRIESQTSKLSAMETKLDLVYEWFKNNVVGKGEPTRHRAEGD